MSPEEIEALPVEVVYVGSDNPTYIIDEKRAFEIILQIIQNMNLMQNSHFQSFLLGMFLFLTICFFKNTAKL
jgi:hypothetical protein